VLEGSALAAALVEQLGQARRTVRICSFLCTLDVRVPDNSPARQVIRAIADAAQRGVDVRVLIGSPGDPRLNLLNSVAARYLNERGAATRRVPEIDLHAKFAVIDDGCCTIGSHNLTHKALSQNAELSAMVWDAATTALLTKNFAAMWEKAKTSANVPQVGMRQTSIQSSRSKSRKNFAAAMASRVAFDTIEVLEDREYLGFCETALAKAQHRIFVAMGLMTFSGLRTHPARQLIERLIAAHDRGVDVNVFTDGSRTGRRSAARKLQASDIPVHFISNGRSFHHKALVIDDQLTIIGSHNWTLPALSKSREISLAIRSTPLAFQMTQAIVSPFAAL
ncbi:MAG TPA: phosphatidylserine/phosphatidylglycerophosphate/cardiolipin synthase family protein, partial [Nitrososphaera sp.]|nr:phosphatidylserine/phosphatidylglycerophosphate/cardiolipin synthase family protein [Nitrososphaera sp.]